VPTNPTPGRSIVTRRAVVDMVRTATLGSYGVTGFGGGPIGSLLERIGLTHPGIRVALGHAAAEPALGDGAEGDRPAGLAIDLDLMVAYGVPVAEVARQVDSAVRYAIGRALGREVARLTIHVEGLRYQPGGPPPAVDPADPHAVSPAQLADSGTDVA
jgi:hypothetical protein